MPLARHPHGLYRCTNVILSLPCVILTNDQIDTSAFPGACATRARGAWLLAAALAPVLPAPGYGDAGEQPREAFPYFGGCRRSCSRSDEGGHHAGPASRAGRSSATPTSPLRAPLGLHAARVPPVSGADERQGGAPRPLRARQFRLRPHFFCMMRISITSGSSGEMAWRMCACMAPRASARASASTARRVPAPAPRAGRYTSDHEPFVARLEWRRDSESPCHRIVSRTASGYAKMPP